MKTNNPFLMKHYSLTIAGLIILLFSKCHSGPSGVIPVKSENARPTYTLAPVNAVGLSSVIKLPGQLAAYEEVKIFPKVNGYVKTVLVDMGSRVHQGQVLMSLEAPELKQSSLQAKEKYTRTRADLSIDKEHYSRLLEASRTPGAISPLDLSLVRAKMESDSAVSNAARTNWEMEQTMQAYLQVIAPFSGVITERNVHPGALVSAEVKDNLPMLVLKNISRLRLQVDIPENLAGNLNIKDTLSFYTSAFPGKKITGHISRKSMNVNAQFRSERIEADVINARDLLTPGMYADIVLYSRGNSSGYTVPKSSVVTSTERKYVLVVRSNKIVKVDVTSGNESGKSIEVFGNLNKSDSVIASAVDEINEGKFRDRE